MIHTIEKVLFTFEWNVQYYRLFHVLWNSRNIFRILSPLGLKDKCLKFCRWHFEKHYFLIQFLFENVPYGLNDNEPSMWYTYIHNFRHLFHTRVYQLALHNYDKDNHGKVIHISLEEIYSSPVFHVNFRGFNFKRYHCPVSSYNKKLSHMILGSKFRIHCIRQRLTSALQPQTVDIKLCIRVLNVIK